MSSIGLRRLSQALDNFMDVSQAPETADGIFVFAGRPERKVYALELFRQGYAQLIIFSVGRFEWRRFSQLGLEHDGGLMELVQKTPAPRRHFFVYLDDNQTQCFLIRKGRFGTLSEAKALAEFVQAQNLASLIVVSSGFHLRRACTALRRYCSFMPLRIIPVASPAPLASSAQENSRQKPECSLIISEYMKYIFYKLLPPFGF